MGALVDYKIINYGYVNSFQELNCYKLKGTGYKVQGTGIILVTKWFTTIFKQNIYLTPSQILSLLFIALFHDNPSRELFP
jgi:hypothetical protein